MSRYMLGYVVTLCYYSSVNNERRILNISFAKFPMGMKRAFKQKIETFAPILEKFERHFKSIWIQNSSRI
jgi:hypothetical protein